MNWLAWLAMVAAFQIIQQAHAKAVFAHFMVTNSENYTLTDWQSDMTLAKDAHIDAFALNMAFLDKTNNPSLEMAFEAANAVGFKLFFSFDYAGNGPWDATVVIKMIQQYGPNNAYFQHNSKPFVSTFEGPGNAEDWVIIKEKTGCFFMPDWSSVGAKPAMALANGVADGLFSWAAWPWGNQTMDTYTDASYLQYLNGKPYMFAVSPWFYTNLEGYNKNWLWKGDTLWFDRWQELLALDPMPDFVQIISWNDYGESHYIGPLREKSMAAFDIGKALYNYVEGYPHDGWRDVLPFLIKLYKDGTASIDADTVVFWYRPHPVSSCQDAGTTVNTASQLQLEFTPASALEDRIYVMAVLSDGNHAPEQKIGPGIFFGSVPFNPGKVQISLWRTDPIVGQAEGLEITTECTRGYNNYNAWVGNQQCIRGKGAYDFNDLCNFTCSYGYCPVGACTCEQMGVPRLKPNATGVIGYPAEGRDANYLGLCSFACNYGHCPSKTCDTKEHPMPVPTVSDFLPPACVAGTGPGNTAGLCSYSCSYGFCPLHLCTCTQTGPLVQPPEQTQVGGMAALGVDSSIDKLCDFTCSRGYCPPQACRSKDDVSASAIHTRWIEGEGLTCTDDEKKAIVRELVYAMKMAQETANNIQLGDYHTTFFGQRLVSNSKFISDTVETYKRVEQILGGHADEFPMKLTCNPNTPLCKNPKTVTVAHMNDARQILNFCPKFFHDARLFPTKDLLDKCDMDLRDAARARSAALVHEATHTKYAMLGKPYTRDVAYGFNACWLLPRGLFDRSCAPWAKKQKGQPPPRIECPNKDENGETVEGVCPGDLAGKNAESYQFVAAGVYFSRKCGHNIPLPPLPPTPSKRATTCPNFADYIFWDAIGDDLVPVTGYVHLGDSFAAGLGTGTTSGSPCRVGSNSYGKLVYDSLDGEDVPFQNVACSGDTIPGLNNKLAGWQESSAYNLGTVTIGGNDVGFSNIVKHCILRYLNSPLGWDAFWCSYYKRAARNLMADTSKKGLQYLLGSIYSQIHQKATSNPDFHLYVAGYPRFFNPTTTECDSVTFKYWSWQFGPSPTTTYLTTDLRKEMNDLVDGVNQAIQAAVTDTNELMISNATHFVDVNPYFEGHRWCEAGVKEPDSSNRNTYFFLSGWPDVTESGMFQQSSADDSNDLSVLEATRKLPLPDGNTCNTTLGENPDPVNVYWCSLAQAVAQEPGGDLAKHVSMANGALADGDFTSQDVSRFLPTRQIKAFHPRSAGMALYRDAILAARFEVDKDWW
ncbi:putative alpha-1,3-glucanase [Aspergillus novofumigatus IBT 16806]|uniref:Mutanase n=1 Tax=Aspergillus novofumigatus (strain IBT 16806) TaxID=1392255 RepID=A0A2I1C0W9_ASPN1|nr:mutanase [Aspergillus novofumigatus IBT 16806]PKX91286.1 mutanase [Aspergillus novofumigatus IBT 16806]